MQNRHEYTQEQINDALKLADMLQQFDNNQIRLMANHRVTDKNRQATIVEVLANEYGDGIIRYVKLNLFGNPKFTVK